MVHLKVAHVITTNVTHSGLEEIVVVKMVPLACMNTPKELAGMNHYDDGVHIHKLDKYTHSMKQHCKYWLILSVSPVITPTLMQNFTKKTHCIYMCFHDSICIDFVPD